MAQELHFDNPAAAAQDPSTDAEALRQLAFRYPEVRPIVAAHPHAYRGLLDWLHQFNDPAINAALEARDDYDGYIDSNGYLVMHGDVSGAVAGSSIRTSESGMYVLGQGGVNSYSQVERTTPYSAVVGSNAAVPKVGAREQVVAQVQRQSIMGDKSAQDPEATAVYPATSVGSSYPGSSSSATRTQVMPQAYPGAGASYQVQPTVQPGSVPQSPTREGRSLPVMGIVLGVLALIAVVLLGVVIFVFTRGYDGPHNGSSPAPSRSASSPRPSASASTNDPVKYPAPPGATKMDNFMAPSGNIKCSFTVDGVTCGIAESNWEDEGYPACSDTKVGTLTVSKTDASQSCASSMPTGGPKLDYTTAATNGDYACRSTEDGVTCWNTRTGNSFALARAGWMTGTTGEINPRDFQWNK
ncbi:sodium pump decarboxylase [Actinomyces bouchesdurhonensis]|uniref:variant leucine-rich repeat-containing protein n=1 Tax=Actinomyces bouchesdurhonensis TaxID=1852361 RepID=UPI003AF11724